MSSIKGKKGKQRFTEESRKKMSEQRKGKNNSFYGKHHTEDSKKKMSLANTGKHHTEETKRKMSLTRMGHITTEETKKKISENHAKYWEGKQFSKEHRQKISIGHMGHSGYWKNKHHNKKTRKKMSESHKGKSFTKEHKQRISLAQRGKIVTEETKQKIRESALERFKNGLPEETRAKISKAMKGRQVPWIKGKHFSEEIRKRMSEAQLGEKNHFYGKHHNEETRNKISLACIDQDFYNEYGCTRSQYPYGSDWTAKLRKQIAERDDYTCQMCNEVLPDKWATHHIDYDKDNSDPSNLIFLCRYCHMKTNHNRTFWEQYFKQLQITRGFGADQYNNDQTTIDIWT